MSPLNPFGAGLAHLVALVLDDLLCIDPVRACSTTSSGPMCRALGLRDARDGSSVAPGPLHKLTTMDGWLKVQKLRGRGPLCRALVHLGQAGPAAR